MKPCSRGQEDSDNFIREKMVDRCRLPVSRELHRKPCESAQTAGDDFIREKMGDRCRLPDPENCIENHAKGPDQMAANFLRESAQQVPAPRSLGNCMKICDRGQAEGNNFIREKMGDRYRLPDPENCIEKREQAPK